MPDALDPTLTPTQADQTSPAYEVPAGRTSYRVGELLGKGGMGEVRSARDERLGREVAIKQMRTTAATSEEIKRFLREAKVQAKLDHPAIVPVYDLGVDSEGVPYFTMKKLVGTTLAKAMADASETQQRMLRALVDVAQAIALAHERKVVHRDLKPSNIMLGDYGAVYVIDWGIARILDDDGDESTLTEQIVSSADSPTRTGALLGTPGFMAPEQVRGIGATPPSDIYALGAILFEILAGEPLHPRGAAALGSTLDKHDGSPAARAPKRAIAPELDVLCARCLSEGLSDRPSARELATGIQQYLDGDRDFEQRRVLAAATVIQARAALDSGERADAVRLGGRALALDPNNEEAAGLVMSLLTKPPEKVPAEVDAMIADADVTAMRERSRRAFFPMLLIYALTPFLTTLVVVNWLPLIAVYATITSLAVLAFINWRVRRIPVTLWLIANMIACITFTRLSGPFVLAPALMCSILMSAGSQAWFNERRWALALFTVVLVVTPFVLEEVGVFARSWHMEAEGIVSAGTIFLRGKGSMWPLFCSNLAIIVIVGQYALAITRDRRKAQRALIIQSWHLRQLLPKGATTVVEH
jgi:serine/threonine-protein kinase